MIVHTTSKKVIILLIRLYNRFNFILIFYFSELNFYLLIQLKSYFSETRYRPSITAVNKTPVAPVGTSVTLQCRIDNSTNIQWSKDNDELSQNTYITPERNLRIDNVQLSNEGRYYCSDGYTRDFVDLRVTGKVSIQLDFH